MRTEKVVWKVRSVKPYPEAQNHILVGRVIARDTMAITLNCRTFHFGRSPNGPRDIKVGPVGTRIVPWQRVEIINELQADFDYQVASLELLEQSIVLAAGGKNCVITDAIERSY